MKANAPPTLRPAHPDDVPRTLELLHAAGLPDTGVAELGGRLVVAEVDGRIVGCAGLEVYGPDGLLRSVVVADDLRGRGVGAALTQHMTELAAAGGLRRLYLLTETAAPFFGRMGFAAIDRNEVGGEVLAAPEFATLCPASAQVMMRVLLPSG